MTDEGRRTFFARLAAFAGLGAALAPARAQAQAAPARQFVKREQSQRSGYSQAVVTQGGGRTIWLAGHTANTGADPSLAGNFEGQVKATFAFLEETLQKAGGKLSDLVTMTVFITDPRNHSIFTRVRRELLGDNFPASAVVSVSHLAVPNLLVEVQAVAVIA
jgi:enamine deaminase RidA (YjgF/YER057c/UK114 family)